MAEEIEENTVDNDFLIAISSDIICRHLCNLVTAGKNTEDINDRKGLQFVISLLIESKGFWQALEKWKSAIFSDKIQVVFDHSRDIYDRRKNLTNLRSL